MWAEKELHNLVKMSRHGLRVPDAVLLKKHVLLMSFIGKKILILMRGIPTKHLPPSIVPKENLFSLY